MIIKDNFKDVLKFLGFSNNKEIYSKKFDELDCQLKVDFKKQELIYPEDKDFTVNERQTCNFKQPENFVVFECVHNLLNQGYQPKHIELEPKWQVGHGASGGRADILVKDNDDKSLLIIECKTAGNEFNKAWNTTQSKPTQLFSYVQQTRSTKFISLYASDFVDGKVISNYYLVNVSDNEELLKNNPKLNSFKEATTVEEIYLVWSQTYGKEYATIGIFEDNKPYDIGKTKFTKNDLKNITSKDIQGKYHEFATILRQHNVSGRENAFDKLVNLFLCKVTDEKQHPDELKFYWKGKAYDDPFDFQDRLQKLYKDGMDKFLDDDITYIDNSKIDEAFEVFKDKENETKRLVKQYLKAQKFFTNNDFAFIDVHNEKLFYQNFEVLLKISRMIQDISLTGSDENQFLGDMFEGFLDQGVKQSEGQFFTPMPIVKFIINSLPTKQDPKVVDYACGAGHFLNEYAAANENSHITGIEKEYRLSKVAKVSSFMYGSDMDIVYDDALKKSSKIQDDHFDVLIANPPYSVKGFLETLSDEDRNSFELIQTIDEKSYTANNAIECFFIERSKQLLTRDGVAGIIVPSSILNKGNQSITSNKGNVYVKTREILLKYFDIVAISEFGSGTFGKTGTNTVTLFIKRRGNNPDLSEHFKNMVNTWFECDFETNQTFEDDGILQKYCSHIEIEFEVYKTILCESLDKKLFDHDTFKEYIAEFEKLSDTKNRRKKKTYKALSAEEKGLIEQNELIKYIRAIEKDKLYYFTLAYKNSSDVVIVKSPSNNNENKKFLGYEWSSAKGNEGIKYLTSGTVQVDDETLDEEDKRILENLQGLKDINTPLYNPNNSEDESKINKIIKDNFEGIKTKIPEELSKYVNRARLIDMLDFSRVDFNKALSLTPTKKIKIESKYSLVKIESVITKMINGSTPPKNENKYWITEDINWLTTPDFYDEKIYIKSTSQFVSKKALVDKKVTIVPINSVVLTCTATIGKVGVTQIELTTNQQINALICNNEKVIPEYLAYFMSTQKENLENLTSNSGVTHINKGMLNNYKIPLPPLDIQKQIINECQKVDKGVEKANKIIEQSEKEIITLIESATTEKTIKLGESCELKAGKFVSASDIYEENTDNLYPCYGGNGLRGYVKTFTHEGTYPLIGRQGALCGNVTLVKGKFHATEHAVAVTPKIELDVIWLYHKLVIMDLNQYKTGTAQPGLSVKNINNVNIEIPSLETQKEIVLKIEKLESKISKAKKIIEFSKDVKNEILRKYL